LTILTNEKIGRLRALKQNIERLLLQALPLQPNDLCLYIVIFGFGVKPKDKFVLRWLDKNSGR
jgi:hypothetical protein